MNMWMIIAVIGGLLLLAWFLWEGFGWKCTVRMLANSYIDAREKDKLSSKEAFLNALTMRFRLKKTSELMQELEERGVTDEDQIKQETKKLLWRNAWRQNAEYRYGDILARKGFLKEATDLKFARSPLEGFIHAGDDIERKMWLEEEWHIEDDNNYGLLELLICGLIIENYKVREKTYNDVMVKKIKKYFKGRHSIEKYLNEPQTIVKEANSKKILDEYISKREAPEVIDQKAKELAARIVSNAEIKRKEEESKTDSHPKGEEQ